MVGVYFIYRRVLSALGKSIGDDAKTMRKTVEDQGSLLGGIKSCQVQNVEDQARSCLYYYVRNQTQCSYFDSPWHHRMEIILSCVLMNLINSRRVIFSWVACLTSTCFFNKALHFLLESWAKKGLSMTCKTRGVFPGVSRTSTTSSWGSSLERLFWRMFTLGYLKWRVFTNFAIVVLGVKTKQGTKEPRLFLCPS